MIEFTRAPAGTALAAGQWRPLRDGTAWSASVGCPTCGQMGTLLDHQIAADGMITPSLVCPVGAEVGVGTCAFHDDGRLLGWPP